MPHVLAHYSVFFGFGALMYATAGAADRLGRAWWLKLPLGLLLLAPALGLTHGADWARDLVPDDGLRHILALVTQACFAWCMIFGLMGLFETVLHRERYAVRFVSDSSYWLYLTHLPLIMVGQMLVRNAPAPAIVKFLALTIVVTAFLLLTYRLFVRYTWIGWLLNGPRTRPGARAETTPA